jgi:hypothetical protein
MAGGGDGWGQGALKRGREGDHRRGNVVKVFWRGVEELPLAMTGR